MSVYIEQRQTGYAVGLKDPEGNRVGEVYFQDDGTAQGIARAYIAATAYAGRVKAVLRGMN